ncbi:MAG: UDP-4-amino-4,6-dideoxy-N-acetyl-beta-L-altrosamine transaminase [Desulfobacteraceae bacterium]|nr:MAG: UDP-4-amino-4,6-dideoxy-N-acetyl-beta-L-altrosamine transaminase [Desulfobacteraceae bacterium]
MSLRILITGVSGLLGNNLASFFSQENDVTGIYRSHPVSISGVKTVGLDLRNYAAIRDFVSRMHPEVVIHCASRVDVDRMEEERDDAWQSNVLATRILADALRDIEKKLIYISSDSVYPGDHGPYSEEMETAPRNWYGETKLEGETIVSSVKRSLIIRTNLYGWNILDKQSLGEWFLAKLERGERISGFVDARFSSIYAFSLAELIMKCMRKDLHGTYNCACRDSLTKFEFGRRVAEVFGFEPDLVLPISIAEADLSANRGRDLSLDVRKIEVALGEPLPTMDESLKRFYRDYCDGVPQQIKKDRYQEPLRSFFPVCEEIGYGRQAIDLTDIDAVVRVMKSPYLTQGNEVSIFEQEIASLVKAEHGIAVSSGTAALHLACLACGLSSGDEGITSPITFLASANAIVYCGATPRFSDIDPRTYNMSAAELEKNITAKTRLVIPVHFAGQSCAMREIRQVVSEKESFFGHKIYIIEDASHALGSLYLGKEVGCCDYSDAAVFSFHPVKHITTGEGGMVVTNCPQIAEKVRMLRSHGMTKDPKDMSRNDGPWYYEQLELGYNYRITDFQCALGRSQLNKLRWFRTRRRKIVDFYNSVFRNVPLLSIPYEIQECVSNFHIYVLQLDFEGLGCTRSELMEALRQRGIQTQVHYIPVYSQPYYRLRLQAEQASSPHAEDYYKRCLSLPLYPGMTDIEVRRVADTLLEMAGKNL